MNCLKKKHKNLVIRNILHDFFNNLDFICLWKENGQ